METQSHPDRISQLEIALHQLLVATQSLIGLVTTTPKTEHLRKIAYQATAMADGVLFGDTPREAHLHAARDYLKQAHALGIPGGRIGRDPVGGNRRRHLRVVPTEQPQS